MMMGSRMQLASGFIKANCMLSHPATVGGQSYLPFRPELSGSVKVVRPVTEKPLLSTSVGAFAYLIEG